MIDYEANVQKQEQERDDFINLVSGIEEDLFEILIKYVKGDIDLHKARRKVLQKGLLLHNYMHEHITGKEYNLIKFNSLRDYGKTEYHRNHEAARAREKAILKEIEEREKEDNMRKNNEQINVPSKPDDYIEDDNTRQYKMDRLLTEMIEEMAALVKEGHEIEWNSNNRWCKINGKVFNVHKNVWESRKNEVL